jgi:hypothetical protein
LDYSVTGYSKKCDRIKILTKNLTEPPIDRSHRLD